MPSGSITVGGADLSAVTSVDYTIRIGREAVDDFVSPGAANFTLHSRTRLPAVDIDQVVHLADADHSTLWHGTTTDVTRSLTWRTVNGVRALWHVTKLVCVGPSARFGRVYVGDEPWDIERDGARVARILSLAKAPVAAPTDPELATGPDRFLVYGIDLPGSYWDTADADPDTIAALIPDGGWSLSAPDPTWDQLADTLTWDAINPGRTWRTYGYAATSCTRPINIGSGPVRVGIDATPGPYTVGIWSAATAAEAVPGKGTLTEAVGIITAANPVIGPVAIPSAHDWITVTIGAHPTTTVSSLTVYRPAIDPGTVDLIRRDVDHQSATAALDTVAASSRGVIWETRAGTIIYDSVRRRTIGNPPTVTLTPDVINSNLETIVKAADRINILRLEYGPNPEEGERPTVEVRDQRSVDTNGEYATSMSTDLEHENDAYALAATLLAAHLDPAPMLTKLTISLTNPHLTPAQRRDLSHVQPGGLLHITGLDPAAMGLTTWRGYIEGVELQSKRAAEGDPDRTIALTVSDAVMSIQPITWDDLPPALDWNSLATNLTWNELTGDKPLTDHEPTRTPAWA